MHEARCSQLETSSISRDCVSGRSLIQIPLSEERLSRDGVFGTLNRIHVVA